MFNYHTMIEENWYIVTNLIFKKKKLRDFIKLKIIKLILYVLGTGTNMKKYILILQGSLKLCVVKIDNWKNPSKNLKKNTFILNEKNPQILYIPGGFAHGSQNLNSNTKFIVFSNFDIKQSLKDDYRFESDYWEVGILNIVKIKYEKYSVPKKK